MMEDKGRGLLWMAAGFTALSAAVIGVGAGGCAVYNSVRVWNAETAGKAELARASSNRRIAVLEAQAMKDSASLKAEAEILRAGGVAKANHIIGKSLGGPDGYLRYLYIQNIEHSRGQIIYIPTEGGLPILEAGRHTLNAQPKE